MPEIQWANITLIVTNVTLHPYKIPCLRRLMRVLTQTGVFGVVVQPHSTTTDADDGSEPVYELTLASRLLGGSASNVSPFLNMVLGTVFVSSFLDLASRPSSSSANGSSPARAARPVHLPVDAQPDLVGARQR